MRLGSYLVPSTLGQPINAEIAGANITITVIIK